MMQIALVVTLVLTSFAVRETTANNPLIGNSARVAPACRGLGPKEKVGGEIFTKSDAKLGIGHQTVLSEGNPYTVTKAEIADDISTDQETVLRAFSKLVKSHVGFRSNIGEHTDLIQTIVKSKVSIGHNVKLSDVYVGDYAIVYPNTLIPNGMVIAPHSAVFQAPSTQNLIETLPQADLHDFHKKFYSDAKFLLQTSTFATQFKNAVDSSFKTVLDGCATANDPNDSKLRKKMSNIFSFLVYVYLIHNYGEKLLDNNVNSDLLKDNHFGCIGPFSYNLNNLGKNPTSDMQTVLALHRDAERLDSERVNDRSGSFCKIAAKLIHHKMKVLAIDAQCAVENTHAHKCYGDCSKLSVLPQIDAVKPPTGKSDQSQSAMEDENKPFATMETTESAFMEHEPFTLSVHIKERIADIIIIINDRNKSTPDVPFTRQLKILPIAVDLINYHSHHDGSGCASSLHGPRLASIVSGVGSSLKAMYQVGNVIHQGAQLIEKSNSPAAAAAKLALQAASASPIVKTGVSAWKLGRALHGIYKDPKGAAGREVGKQLVEMGINAAAGALGPAPMLLQALRSDAVKSHAIGFIQNHVVGAGVDLFNRKVYGKSNKPAPEK